MFKKFEIRPVVLKSDGGVEFCHTYAEAQVAAENKEQVVFGLYGGNPQGPDICYQHIADVSSKQAMLDLVKSLFGIALDWADQDRIEFMRPRDLAAMSVIGDLLQVLHPGAVGLIHNEHGEDRGKAACEAVTAAKAYMERGSAMEVLSGYFSYEGTILRADFQVPVGATTTEKDAAFMASLAQQAEIDYLAIGEADNPLPEGDIGLTAAQLESRYGQEHPDYTREDWRHDVSQGDTKLGYWIWVLHQVESRQYDQGNSSGDESKMVCTAFQVTEEDIENVLRNYSLRVTDTCGKSFETMAAELIGEIDCGRVEKAALNSGCGLDEQTQGAYDEIKNILVEIGVLEF